MNTPIETRLTQESLNTINQDLEEKSPQEILDYAFKQYFPNIILACSFGAEDVVLVDMMLRLHPNAELFYLDTDFLFPETYEVRDHIISKYGLNAGQVHQIKSELTPEEQAKHYGDALWSRDPDQCCKLRKVEPLARVLKNYSAWITGIRRDQSPARAKARLIEWDQNFQLMKVNPLAAWSGEQVWAYIFRNDVPYNILHERHYPSVGCTHCTAPVMPGDDPRSGRWKNSAKTECGLHR
ncbi:MAG: phosphoadenylyl-sulfate reductase [Nitrospirales bacterium]|nr:phosphoadenylyl-sulfate reductase [Nitrospirales bacterium]